MYTPPEALPHSTGHSTGHSAGHSAGHPAPSLTAEAARFLFHEGYSPLRSEKIASFEDHFKFLKSLEDRDRAQTDPNVKLFKQDFKNAGSLTLDFQSEAGKKLIPQFIEVLFSSGLIQEAIDIIGHPIYLNNFMHMITRPGDQKLAWHRDTYVHDEKLVGPAPPGYKIMVYNSDVENGSEFEFLRGTHRLDFNSSLIDRMMAGMKIKNYVFRGKRGSSLLFDISLLHRRRAPSKNQVPRSATIFGFLRTRRQQSLHLPKHQIEISDYNSRLAKLGYI